MLLGFWEVAAVVAAGVAAVAVLRAKLTDRQAALKLPPLSEKSALALMPANLHPGVLPGQISFSTMVSSQGLRIATYSIRASKPVGAVVLVHGFRVSFRFEFFRPVAPGEAHTMWEGSQIERLVSAGLSVFAIDLQGHGQSDGVRAHVQRFDDLPKDVLQFCRERVVPELRSSNLPLYLYGQSLGGAVVARLAQLGNGAIDGYPLAGLVCGAPAIALQPHGQDRQSPLVRLVLALAAFLVPERPMPVGSGPNGIDPEGYPRECQSEPTHYSGNPRFGFVHQLLEQSMRFMASGGLEAVRVRSLLAVHSKADTLTQWRGSEALFARATAARKALVLLRGIGRDGHGEVRHTVDGSSAPADESIWDRHVLDLPLWHNYTREPGGDALGHAIAQWLRQEALLAAA